MVWHCFFPKSSKYDTGSNLKWPKKKLTGSKSAMKKFENLKSLIGSPKDFMHYRSKGPEQPGMQPYTNSGSPRFSCIVVNTSRPQTPSRESARYTESPISFSGSDRPQPSPDKLASSQTVIKIKRKSVPVYSQLEIEQLETKKAEATRTTLAEVAEVAEVAETNEKSEVPLDARGRPLHCLGGEYMTQTAKLNWDEQMAAIANALKEGSDEPDFLKNL
ncbi:uncharacterized protein MELLADRAFT_71304 [Melampsora larici-populina 98AG31]|uniref:Uncharacterized protein n=1 Tax=Melampsora larici-populina (strain 98AG31 / pathotype 3-4-7) TaxID=747676 RepID=F4REN8_MELLP|nr:uncharacterized protein MELLADRAFT_71304 [Melampsora larici-populina 98AG31]EGG09132.1 hypothetical protein MELLADRAFT_71304 [Melampsora larici-populina 98AG31]